MLEQLIHSVRVGLISYLRMIEAAHYHGPTDIQPNFAQHFSQYIKKTIHLSDARKSHLLTILKLCHDLNCDHVTPKQFSLQLLTFIMPLRSTLERWLGKYSRLQLAMIHAVEQYSLNLITMVQGNFKSNHEAVDDPLDPFQVPAVVALRTDLPAKQLHNMSVMITSFQEQLERQSTQLNQLSIALAEERDKQATIIAENQQLARTVCELQAMLIEHKALTMEICETTVRSPINFDLTPQPKENSLTALPLAALPTLA